MPHSSAKPDVRSQTLEELQARFAGWGEPAYRVPQLLAWIYLLRATDWDAMTNLPKALRDRLKQEFSLYSLELVRKQGSQDATRKFLWRLEDHALIESVLIPASPALYGEPSDRHTLCVSTQVGCAYGCKFCASGLGGWKRNLTVGEIVDQVLATEREGASAEKREVGKADSENSVSGVRPSSAAATFPAPHFSGIEHPDTSLSIAAPGTGAPRSGVVSRFARASASRLVSNLVVMGMGEPLANYENLLKALKILNAHWGGAIGARKITISTSGLAPQIRQLADEPLQFRLAVSLHGADDATRGRIMPVNRKYPLTELVAACEYYQRKKGRMITFEYILIAGINDGLDQVKPLAALARRLNAKVNLIPYNPVEGLDWQRPSEEAQETFHRALAKEKIAATLRREKGQDIDAACGQLRLKTERELIG
jgi:23S rRNA (adenine2503-C2)-methyltransferase